MSRAAIRIAVLAVAVSALALVPSGAESPQPPPFYAIQNVRVITGTGEVLESATVLVGDGLIEAVGTRVSVPGDAWVIDGEGLTLYPGLIDAMTTLGQKQTEEGAGQGGGGRQGGGGSQIRGPQDRPGTTPYLSVADELAEDTRIEKWRKAGFAAAVSTPEDGFFAGQAAVISLGDREPRESVVAAGVAQRLNFSGGGGFRAYPGSLMGILGYVRQVFSDAEHYSTARAVYARDPRGKQRLDHDRTLAPLEAAMADGTPFLMPANLGREIDRALRIADEYDLNAVIYGGQGAYDRLEALAAAGTPVLVNLNWPEPEKNRDPEADTPIRTLYHYRAAPATPAMLAEAGIPFAFYSGGLASASEVFKSVRAAIDAGLSEEDALTAMTSSPATILGFDDRLGTIERGKIANFVLASDWPWAEGVEVAAVFVDGRRFAERKSDEPTEPPAQDVSGTWAITMTTPRGTQELTAELEMSDDGKVTGEITGRATTSIDEGRMSGDLLRFETTRSMGERTVTASWSLSVEGESLSGTMSAGPMSMEISGERTAVVAAADESAAAAAEDGEPEISLEEIAAVVAKAHGPVREMGSFAITNATVWTVSGETIENGTVVVRDGRITAVGADVRVPSGIETFDAAGGHVIPGIIDAHSHIAVEGGVNEGSLAVTSMVAIGDVLHPDQIAIYRALAGGVTSANLLHGSANPIGGLNQVIKLRWGRSAEELKFEGAPPGIKFALGENPKRSNFRSPNIPERYPQTRMGVMDVIRQAFLEAQEYRQEWEAYEASPGGIPPRRDRKLDALVEILEGERLVHSHCYRADEILQLLRVAEEFGFRIATLQHVLEGYKVADEIAAHGAGASTFSDWWGYKMEAYEAIPYNAALMTERGVLVSINSDSGEEMRHLNQEAAKAVKWGGMDEVEALALVTLNPARQLGIDDRVGSIEVGKDADLVVYDEHPLSVFAVVQQTFIDGDLYFDVAADRERQAAIDDMKARLMPKDDAEDSDETTDEESAPAPAVDWGSDEIYSCSDEVTR